jgi:hypothetical protein
MSHIDASKR